MFALKIALVRPFFTRRKGGAENYAVALARSLVVCGHRVHVFAHRWDYPEDKRLTYHRVRMVRKPGWLRVLSFHWHLRRCLVFDDYDIVLGMTPFYPQMVFWLGDGLYHVWTRVAWPLRLIRWFMCMKRAVMALNLWLERRIMRGGAAHFIVNSRLVKRQAIGLYGVPQRRVSVVYPGVDLSRFNPEIRTKWRLEVRKEKQLSDNELVLLFVSNNFKRKGLDLILRALAAMPRGKAGVRLLVVGGGRIWFHRWLAKYRGISDRLSFIGRTGDIERYYAAADAFVLPTRYDPFAAVCLEAMACGLPVITTRMNGAAELITTGKNGFLLDLGNIESDLERCLGLLLDEDRRAEMGALAAEAAKAYSIEAHVEGIISVLDRVAANRRRQRQLRVIQPIPHMVINQRFLPLLERHGLVSHTAIGNAEGASPIDYNRSKRIFLFKLQHQGQQVTLYLKHHRSPLSLSDRCRRLFRKGIPADGMHEWENVLAFHDRGLPAMIPVAAGECIAPGSIKESFLMTLGLDDYEPVDHYTVTHFAPPLDAHRLKKKRALLKATAQLTLDMHWIGFNHRDYYLCHLFVKDTDCGVPELRIIDLQRVAHRMFPSRRWLVKDLAQLHYSSLPLPLTDKDRLRFFAIYSSGERNRSLRRKTLRQILHKSQSITRHDARLRARDPEKVTEDRVAFSSNLIGRHSRHDKNQ